MRWFTAVGVVSLVCLAPMVLSEPPAAPGAQHPAACAKRLTVVAAIYKGLPLRGGASPRGMNGCWTWTRPIRPLSPGHHERCKYDNGIWAFDDLAPGDPPERIDQIRRCARAHRGTPGYVHLAWRRKRGPRSRRGWRKFGSARLYQLYETPGGEHLRRSYNPRALVQWTRLGRPGGPTVSVGAFPLTIRQLARDVVKICKETRHGVLGLYGGSRAFLPYRNYPQSRLDAVVAAINRCTANPFASTDPAEPPPPPPSDQPQPQPPTAHDADWRLKRGVRHQRLLPAPTDPDSSIDEWILVRQTFRTTDFEFRWHGNGYFDIRAPDNFPDDQIVYFTYRVRDSQGLESNRAIATIRFCAEDARDGCA